MRGNSFTQYVDIISTNANAKINVSILSHYPHSWIPLDDFFVIVFIERRLNFLKCQSSIMWRLPIINSIVKLFPLFGPFDFDFFGLKLISQHCINNKIRLNRALFLHFFGPEIFCLGSFPFPQTRSYFTRSGSSPRASTHETPRAGEYLERCRLSFVLMSYQNKSIK